MITVLKFFTCTTYHQNSAKFYSLQPILPHFHFIFLLGTIARDVLRKMFIRSRLANSLGLPSTQHFFNVLFSLKHFISVNWECIMRKHLLNVGNQAMLELLKLWLAVPQPYDRIRTNIKCKM